MLIFEEIIDIRISNKERLFLIFEIGEWRKRGVQEGFLGLVEP